MIRQDIRKLIETGQHEGISLREVLGQTPYDDLFQVDLQDGSFSVLENVVDKYYGISREGDFARLVAYAADHFVHPEDRDVYLQMFDLQTIEQRFAQADPNGILEGEIRMRATNDSWIRTQQVVVNGLLLDPKEAGQFRVYIYDMQEVVQEDDFSVFIPGIDPDVARYGALTGLLSSFDFFAPAQQRLEEFRDGWCLIDIDIKHFKLFIDWYGVESGRYLISGFAEALRDAERVVGGMCGHIGQDEFCLIVPYDKAWIEALQADLQELISSFSPIEGFIPYFGIAMIDDSSNQIQEFFNRAALTNDEIKDNINTAIRIYDPAIHKQNAYEYELLFAFQHAIERGEITFHLQPQFRVSNHKVVGAEALARWHREDGSWISPAVFVPILEKHGLVYKLDTYIWESVCRWCRSWLDRGHTLVPISINVSRQDISRFDVSDHLEDLLRKYGLTTKDLKIEITETAYADDFNPVSETVAELRGRGFSVLMDDFGSGYSSLSMLRTMNMDVIKLDAQFLRIDRETETKGVSILESIVNMTRNLSTPIIVEGVEDEYQAQFLTELGCAYMQGYYFARPMSVEKFEGFIEDAHKIDEMGLVFKANQELRVREFFDANIYSDAMLNNVLGPIAFYNQVGEDISIIRYNEQFFEMVGLTEQEMDQRIEHIQEYMPPEDRKKLLEILASAEEHPTLGGHGVVRALRPNGVLLWLEMKVFFLEEDRLGKKFYISARDVSETYFLSSDMPGAYYRTTIDDDFEFMFISQNFLDLTGYTREEIRYEFDNKMNNMTHPADRVSVHEWSHRIINGQGRETRPYRIRVKRGGYIWIAEKDQITDRFGAPCYQSIAIDVTDVMAMRNQMRILSEHLTDSILFVRPVGDGYEFEAVVYNLEDALGSMTAQEFEDSLNDGSFFDYIDGYTELIDRTNMSLGEFIRWHQRKIAGKRGKLDITLPSGEKAELSMRADRVADQDTRVEFIIMLRAR